MSFTSCDLQTSNESTQDCVLETDKVFGRRVGSEHRRTSRCSRRSARAPAVPDPLLQPLPESEHGHPGRLRVPRLASFPLPRHPRH